ncbi:MAG: hypothetical protein LBT80_02045 [Lactobacillaceae bacterium]|jgi:uncharacterized membrane protein YczE|nr:hypothetical protein [Lactobacillaceae bacterium]
MFNINGVRKPLKIWQQLVFFILGISFNAVGNGITVATNMGSAPWTASAANLSNAFGLSIGVFLFIYGLLAASLAAILIGHLDIRKFFANMFFVVSFSLIINEVSHVFIGLGFMNLPLGARIIIDILAIGSVAIGVSINSRVQLIMHPLDDLVVITRFKYFKGSAIVAQGINFAIPMIISLTVWLVTHEIMAVNIGTLVALFGQGAIIGWGDKHVFSKLVHRRTEF